MLRRPLLGLTLLALAGCATAPKLVPGPAPVPLPPPAVPIPPPPPQGEPATFLNLSAGALRARLGAPQFVRPDGEMQMWRYDGAQCRTFFFLSGQPGAVRHVETLPAGKTSAADPACLSALAAAKPAP